MGLVAVRLVGDQHLKHQFAGFGGAFGIRLHHHAVGHRANAGSGQRALAFDLDHAGAAVAIGAVAGRGFVAEMRDLQATAMGGFPDGVIVGNGDFFAVEGKRDRLDIRHVLHCASPEISSPKCCIISLIGLEAACPKPQIEASPMIWQRSPSKS